MPKVEFFVAYSNGQIGVNVDAGETIELSKVQVRRIQADMRNPEQGMRVLGGKKKAKAAHDEG